MSGDSPGNVLQKIIELSKVDVLIAGLEAQKKKFETERANQQALLKNLEGQRNARAPILENKKALVSREEKSVKQERDRINERRRALTGHTDYKVQQAMEREIEFVAKQIGQREDVLLGVMREVETLERDIVALNAAKGKAESDLQEFELKAAGEVGAIDERLADYNRQRTVLVTDIGPSHVGFTTYNRVRSRYPMDPIVPILNKTNCGGCHMSLGPQLIVQAARGDVVKCAGCSRILRLEEEQAAA